VFLESCHDCLEVINLSCSIELDILEIILNYIERSNNNSLKLFGVKILEGILDDELLRLSDQIKAKGVKIVDFDSTSHKDDFSFIV
jgi:hypothetical protein